MIAATRPIDILLVEDDPGDELITREAFEHNKLQNRLHASTSAVHTRTRRGPTSSCSI